MFRVVCFRTSASFRLRRLAFRAKLAMSGLAAMESYPVTYTSNQCARIGSYAVAQAWRVLGGELIVETGEHLRRKPDEQVPFPYGACPVRGGVGRQADAVTAGIAQAS